MQLSWLLWLLACFHPCHVPRSTAFASDLMMARKCIVASLEKKLEGPGRLDNLIPGVFPLFGQASAYSVSTFYTRIYTRSHRQVSLPSLSICVMFQAVEEFLSEVRRREQLQCAGLVSQPTAVKFLMARKFDVSRAVDLLQAYKVQLGPAWGTPLKYPFQLSVRSYRAGKILTPELQTNEIMLLSCHKRNVSEHKNQRGDHQYQP